MNIANITTSYDETEVAAVFIALNSEVDCTLIEAIRYVCAEHEYLNEIGLNLFSSERQFCQKYNNHDMLRYISSAAHISKEKAQAFRYAECDYLNLKYKLEGEN